VPAVVGLLKPVILVPLGIFSHLSVEQVEAILVHELAHIRRKDFAVNLLQRIAESFFFFNPCIIWMSSLIREEREACCDDIVLEYTADKKIYLEALISFRDTSFLAGGHVLALAGTHSLLNRVKRILTNENKKLNIMEKITLIVMVLVLTAFGFIPRENISIQEPRDLKQKHSPTIDPIRVQPNTMAGTNGKLISPVSIKDTVPERTITFKNISSVANDDGKEKVISVTALGSDGKKYSYKLVNDEIKELSIDGVPVASDKYRDYELLIKNIEDRRQQITLADMEKGKLLHHQLKLQQEKDLNKELVLLKLQHADIEKKNQLILDEKIKWQTEFEKNANQDRQKMQIDDIQKKNQLILEEKINRQNKLQLNEDLKLKNAQLDNIQMKNQLILDDKNNYKLQLDAKEQVLRDQQLKLQKISLQPNDEVGEIIDDLSEAGLVKDKTRLSFTLNDHELIVDGKKQDGGLHEKFRTKYIRNKKDFYKYKRDGHSTTTEIVRD